MGFFFQALLGRMQFWRAHLTAGFSLQILAVLGNVKKYQAYLTTCVPFQILPVKKIANIFDSAFSLSDFLFLIFVWNMFFLSVFPWQNAKQACLTMCLNFRLRLAKHHLGRHKCNFILSTWQMFLPFLIHLPSLSKMTFYKRSLITRFPLWFYLTIFHITMYNWYLAVSTSCTWQNAILPNTLGDGLSLQVFGQHCSLPSF